MKNALFLISALLFSALGLPAQQLPEGLITLDGYAASVNGRIITVGDVMTAIDPVRKQLARKYKGNELKEKMDEAFKKGLQLLVEREMILEDFKKSGAFLPEQMVEDKVNEIINERFKNNRAAFMDALEVDGVTLDEWKEQIREQLIISLYKRREVYSRAKVSPTRVRNLYETRLNSFRTPERVHLQMLVMHAGDTEEEKAQQLQQMKDIEARIKAGATFAELAREHSQGSKAEDGGDLGWLETTSLRPELKEEVQSMKTGDVRSIVGDGKEYYLLRLIERDPASFKPFPEVQEELEAELLRAEEQELYTAWMIRLKNKYYVKLF